MSAGLKGCVTCHFLDLIQVRYNCAKFHRCRIHVANFKEGDLFAPPPSVSTPKETHFEFFTSSIPSFTAPTIFKHTGFEHTGIVVNIWDKVFKNGPSEICGRQPILLGPFLNTLTHLILGKGFTKSYLKQTSYIFKKLYEVLDFLKTHFFIRNLGLAHFLQIRIQYFLTFILLKVFDNVLYTSLRNSGNMCNNMLEQPSRGVLIKRCSENLQVTNYEKNANLQENTHAEE